MGTAPVLGYGGPFGDERERFDMSSGAWSCPHDLDGVCQRVQGAVCAPGMRGCVLEGKVRFAREEMNLPRKPVKAVKPEPAKKPAQPPKRRLPF
ncbi:hypothetical protein LLG90_04480 [Aromatoleum toluclasticum]|uniref:hypothetical protein n=2 Tax=Aromatoleum toluclasticum TaxID=92003 RepID=UPI001D1816C4|nr:hypothetical protein [Aromatoleum toluclasticum]MCC4114605.1 hypothetical protein [Aromatoleum toluclasticum]